MMALWTEAEHEPGWTIGGLNPGSIQMPEGEL